MILSLSSIIQVTSAARRCRMAMVVLSLLLGAHHVANATTFTVTNSNDSGPGSLRNAVAQANADFATPHTIAFAIPTTDPGYNPARGVVTISLTSAGITLNHQAAIDGTTQTTNIGDTNPGQLGTGGVVGTDNISLPKVDRPEIEITNGGGFGVGIQLNASGSTVRGIAIYGFGSGPFDGNIVINADSILIERNIIATRADSIANPGTLAGSGLASSAGANCTIRNNIVAYAPNHGMLFIDPVGWLIELNEIRNNNVTGTNYDGVTFGSSVTNSTIRANLATANRGTGIRSDGGSSNLTITDNTSNNNGIGSPSNHTAGIFIIGNSTTVDHNVSYSNYGAGVIVQANRNTALISHNSIYSNGTITNEVGAGPTGQIGIDLLTPSDTPAQGTSPYVTINKPGGTGIGANDLLNFPILLTAQIASGNLTLTGFARPGSLIELFIAAPDPTGFGEGQTYLTTLVEGSGADTDNTTGTYGPGPINGLSQGTDTTNRFRFTIPVPGGVVSGTRLTSTATLGGETSEFSGNATVTLAPNVTLAKSVTQSSPQPPGTDLSYTVQFTNTGGAGATILQITDPLPANTDFKVGSATSNLGTTGLTVAITYSNNNGATYTYTPVSAGGGAPPGYDRSVTQIRFTFTGTLSQTAPNNQGSVSLTTRIR